MANWLSQSPWDMMTGGGLEPTQGENPTTYWSELNRLGGVAGYMQEYPEVFNPNYGGRMQMDQFTATCLEMRRLKDQIADYRQLKNLFPGTEATYIRWLIDKKVAEISYERDRLVGNYSSLGHYMRGIEEPPVPDWMKEYLEPSMPLEEENVLGAVERRGRRPETETTKASTLRPLGAQAELTPEQMSFMAGYQSWGKAGSPYQFSDENIKAMADWERWWVPYTRLSESLFPTKAKLGSRWATAFQR